MAALGLLLAVFAAGRAAGAGSPGKPDFHTGLEAGYEAAAADHALVLAVFGADWCGPCKLLQSNTLDAAEFLDHAGALHIAHVDTDANPKTAAAFNVEAIPTLVLLTEDRKVIAHRTGYLTSAELLDWLADGRRRAGQGQWEGTAPGDELAALSRKAAGDALDPADVARLAGMLAEADPAERAVVSRLLLGQREQAMPVLLDAVTNAYLGTRIAAGEMLHKLAPGAATFDPWQSPADLEKNLADLRKWWADTGTLPAATDSPAADPSLKNSIEAALQALATDDPVRRTAAMSALVDDGAAALPAVRAAIQHHEQTGDRATALLLEDVRWAILIPDTMEKQFGGLRAALARGASPEQQAAATKLGGAGHDGIPPLAELAASPDPLVAENAVHALSGIGGEEALPAMAALLKSDDSNLRMTAAQALAHTKDPKAVPHLLAMVDDPNEVVACAAVAGIEEVNAVGYGVKKPAAPEVASALRRCLADPRWRLRAAAAEAGGKLGMTELAPDLKKLLDDPDAFVVKTTLTALNSLSSPPGLDELVSLSRRLPNLRGDAVEFMVRTRSPDAAKTVGEIFDSSSVPEQVRIVEALSKGIHESEQPAADETWEPLLASAAQSHDARVRYAAARELLTCPPAAVAPLVGRLLGDEDAPTRQSAAGIALEIIGLDQKPARNNSGIRVNGAAPANATNVPVVTPEMMASWHAALAPRVKGSTNLMETLADFVTGDGRSDLPLLADGFQKTDVKTLQWFGESGVLKLVLAKLSLPDARAALDGICRSPGIFALAVAAAQEPSVRPEVAAYLRDPARFRAAVEPAAGTDLKAALESLLDSGGRFDEANPWSLSEDGPQQTAIVAALADATNAAWRAAAVFVLGQHNAATNLALFESRAKDPDPWVRAAAAQALGGALENDRSNLEAQLGPLLADTNDTVVRAAAAMLLEPEVRNAAGLEWVSSSFNYEDTRVSLSMVNQSEDRPLATLDSRPAFLDEVRRRASGTGTDANGVFTLLLAQYGEFTALDRLLADPTATRPGRQDEEGSVVLAAIGLSHDARYIPALRALTQSLNNQYELRKVLQAARGMSGPDVRQFRLDINKQIREHADNPME